MCGYDFTDVLNFTCEEALEHQRRIIRNYSEINDKDLLKVSRRKIECKMLGVSLISIMLYGGTTNVLSINKGMEVV